MLHRSPVVREPPRPVVRVAPLVLAERVSRAYRSGRGVLHAVVDASCMIRPGDRIALVGRSGSGKSTLLHLFAGLDTPSSGALAWPALGPRETLRPGKVAFVFQTASLLPPLTVVENVALPLMLGGSTPAVAQDAARDALERLDLLHLQVQLPEALSGGQAQRVALARALATRPTLMLADEPTGQLDHATARQVLDTLFAALAGTDTALVIATHDPLVTERFATVWQMQAGRLEGAER